jgi:hypothetical protein
MEGQEPAETSLVPQPGQRIGPTRKQGDGQLSKEEEACIQSFCREHDLPMASVTCASLLNPDGTLITVVIIVDIEIMRKLVVESGVYSRADPPEFERDLLGRPAAATVRVYRTDRPRGLARTAFWYERAPATPDGDGVEAWKDSPDRMLAEVAEALALRCAFPQQLSGVYTRWDLDDAFKDLELAVTLAKHDLRHLTGTSG